MRPLKILHLSLQKLPFAVMVTREKRNEYRRQSKWLMSRLLNKDGTDKYYDIIRFTNGYGKDKPSFDYNYLGYCISEYNQLFKYSNGLVVQVDTQTVIIRCGDIIAITNHKITTS